MEGLRKAAVHAFVDGNSMQSLTDYRKIENKRESRVDSNPTHQAPTLIRLPVQRQHNMLTGNYNHSYSPRIETRPDCMPFPVSVPVTAQNKKQNMVNQWLWQCCFCTYLNNQSIEVCVMCNSYKKPYSQLVNEANIKPNYVRNAVMKVTENVEVHPIITILPAPVTPTANQPAKEWVCDACTYLNPAEVKLCDMCEKLRNPVQNDVFGSAVYVPRTESSRSAMENKSIIARDSPLEPISSENLKNAQIPTSTLTFSNEKLLGNKLNPVSTPTAASVSAPTAGSTSIRAPTPTSASAPTAVPFNALSPVSVPDPGCVYSPHRGPGHVSTLDPVAAQAPVQSLVVASTGLILGKRKAPGDDFEAKDDDGIIHEMEKDPIHKIKNYLELQTFYNTDLITCLDHFECTVCLNDYYPGEGIILKDCLHTFCRECLVRAVECNTDAEVRCPYSNEVYQCSSKLQDREIKALVSAHAYEKYLSRSVKEAEQNIENAFHCKTADCQGWCIFEGNIGVFECPVCNQTNCLGCKAIHTNMSCQDYQEKMTNDQTNQASKKHLQELLQTQKAMTCPKCKAVLMKDSGCDWLRCSVCKLEICWATRGPRWGSRGRGDKSGGCRCGVRGKKCHPMCMNCH